MITEKDKALLAKKGISEEKFEHQLACFASGFPFLRLAAAASVEKGILTPNAEEEKDFLTSWENYTTNEQNKVVKFVPASGAASRMFKNVFASWTQNTMSLPQISRNSSSTIFIKLRISMT